MKNGRKKTPLPESAIELYLPSDRQLSEKLVPTFGDVRCHVDSVKDPYGRILGFLDRISTSNSTIIICTRYQQTASVV
jgi:hypothetical protein